MHHRKDLSRKLDERIPLPNRTSRSGSRAISAAMLATGALAIRSLSSAPDTGNRAVSCARPNPGLIPAALTTLRHRPTIPA